MTIETILNEVAVERAYQNQRWGTAIDDVNTPFHWNAYINQYASRNLIGNPNSFTDLEAFRVDMLKVAALAVAAIEAIDRNN